MNFGIELLVLMIFLFFIYFTSTIFDATRNAIVVKRLQRKYSFTMKDIHYSFDPITYFPNNFRHIEISDNQKVQNILMEIDYDSRLFATIVGIKFYYGEKKEQHLIAYYPFHKLASPFLDRLLREKKINQALYISINKYMLYKKSFKKRLTEEIWMNIVLETKNPNFIHF